MRAWRSRPVPEGIRITKVGLWFVLFTVIVGVAATNTGNNALYLVLSGMLALLVVSGVVSRRNLRGLEVDLEAAGDLFARRPATVGFRIRNQSRWRSRWLVLAAIDPRGPWQMVSRLGPRQMASGEVDALFPRRGRHALRALHLASLFPLGLFRKGLRYPVEVEILVLPEIFPAGEIEVVASGLVGDRSASRSGWGHELHAMRGFRQGDDPRGIHWKKSAQTGGLVYQEREAEESLRLSIALDNGTGTLGSERERERFERIVSEAATAAVDHLDRGFEVEMVTRSSRIPFGSGARHRRELLETLALVGPAEPSRTPLVAGDPGARELRLSLAPALEAGAA